jgi:hypothetical protein
MQPLVVHTPPLRQGFGLHPGAIVVAGVVTVANNNKNI